MITLYTADFKKKFYEIANKINLSFNKNIVFDLGENEIDIENNQEFFYKRIEILKDAITNNDLFESQEERKSLILDQDLNKKINSLN